MYQINGINKRIRAVKHFSNYLLGGVVVLALTWLVILAASGYDIDRDTGRVIQNGVILVETDPEGATVSLNGVTEPAETPAKYPVPAGEYSVDVFLEGYRPWSTQVDVVGSQVNWLYYPLLIPNTITTENIDQLPALRFIEQSPRRDQILIAPSDRKRLLELYELDQETIRAQPIAIPTSLLTVRNDKVVGTIEFVSWSPDGRYVLLKNVRNSNTDFLVIDLRQPVESVNLRDVFNVAFEKAWFSSDSQLLLQRSSRLYQVSVAQSSLPEPIMTGVVKASARQLDWAEVRSPSGNYIARFGEPENRIISLSRPVRQIRAAVHENQSIVVVMYDSLVEIYRDPKNDIENVPEKVIQTNQNTALQVSPSGRFVAFIDDEQTRIYDFENQQTYRHDTGQVHKTAWLDGYRLQFSNEDTLHIVDFDAQNAYNIAGYAAEFGAFIDRQDSAIYSINKSASRLRSSSIKIELE